MPVTAETAAPYAPASAVLEIVQRHRDKGLPPVVDSAVLERAGISHSLVPRTLQALEALDLIDAGGRPTRTFEGIRLAPESDLKVRLAEWLNTAYADALAFIDPATATESQIRDAFRHYKPVGQQSRMVTLFLGLYAAAGVSADRQRAKRQRSEKAAIPHAPSAGAPVAERGRPQRERQLVLGTNLPAHVGGLLTKLPNEGSGWTRQQRDKFMTAFGAVLDVCFPILTEGEREEEPSEEDTDR
jgi:hypothetical protein